jgi:SAM-dependent methyltransferase
VVTSVAGWWRLLSTLRKAERLLPAPGTFFYQELEDVRVDRRPREEIIVELCRGKNVLHFGFTDAPLTRERLTGGNLLHTRIRAVAKRTYGVDIDEPAMTIYREITGDARFSRLDIESDEAPEPAIDESFDLVVFGETLEHLRNPGLALGRLHALCAKNPGCVLCTTVPNAFSTVGFTAASRGVELVHPEHYAYYSPVTLRNVLAAHGFGDIALTVCPYQSHGFDVAGIADDCVLATSKAAAAAPGRGAVSSP